MSLIVFNRIEGDAGPALKFEWAEQDFSVVGITAVTMNLERYDGKEFSLTGVIGAFALNLQSFEFTYDATLEKGQYTGDMYFTGSVDNFTLPQKGKILLNITKKNRNV